MKKSISLCLIFLLITLSLPVFAANEAVISQETVRYLGRWTDSENGHSMNWPLSGVEFTFTGTGAEIYVSSKSGTVYANALVDGKRERIKIESTGWVTLASNLKQGEHTISFTRSSEAWSGKMSVSKVRTTDGTPVPTEEKERKILFVGDSYTAGYGNMASEGTVVDYSDAWESWAGFASRELNADAHVIAFAGKGILNGRNHKTMVEEFEYADCVTGSEMPVQWEHSQFQPQVIVVFLGTNDSAYSIDEFCDAYVSFLTSMRKHYPYAAVVCCGKTDSKNGTNPGNMQTTCVTNAVKRMGGEKAGFYAFTLTSFKASGIGSHPLSSEQQAMAQELTSYLKKNKNLWGAKVSEPVFSKTSSSTDVTYTVKNLEDYPKTVSVILSSAETENGYKTVNTVKMTTKQIAPRSTETLTAQVDAVLGEIKGIVVNQSNLQPLHPVVVLKNSLFYVGQQNGEQNESVSVYQINSFDN